MKRIASERPSVPATLQLYKVVLRDGFYIIMLTALVCYPLGALLEKIDIVISLALWDVVGTEYGYYLGKGAEVEIRVLIVTAIYTYSITSAALLRRLDWIAIIVTSQVALVAAWIWVASFWPYAWNDVLLAWDELMILVWPKSWILLPCAAAGHFFVTLACCVPLCTTSVVSFRQTARRRLQGLCVQCGYSLEGNTSLRCPECGRSIDIRPAG